MLPDPWRGKKVAFLGDSITDKLHVGTTKNYWDFLAETLGIEPLVYGINGQEWRHAVAQGERLLAEHGNEVDAIFLFFGTNDYNHDVPPGDWWILHEEKVDCHGETVERMRRAPNLDETTLCGRINRAMQFLKTNFPRCQIVLMTPIHRGEYIGVSPNIQAPESFPNALGLYFDAYVKTIREAADIWSVPLIDLYRDSGLLPELPAFGIFVHDEKSDRLHPGTDGHRRIAETMRFKMLALPASFR